MKNKVKRIICSAVAAAMCLSLSGCNSWKYAVDANGEKVTNHSVDYIQEKYTADECRAEAERLFGMEFDIISRNEPVFGEDVSSFKLRSYSLPFDITVYSGREVFRGYDRNGNPAVELDAHAWCDYYEKMMDYKQDEADRLAEKYSLEISRDGQASKVYVSDYSMLEKVCNYLNETNRLYSFTVVEQYMTNILRDIRSRPELNIYLDPDTFGTEEQKVITLYYTINRSQYDYTMQALIPAVQESYINCLDALGLTDGSVTSSVRAEREKPALTTIAVNGKPLFTPESKYGLSFDYNWLLNDYYGDIMIANPAVDYTLEQGYYGDDRVFKTLVEALGGVYTSEVNESSPSLPSGIAKWALGGNNYSATVYYQQLIPTISLFYRNTASMSVNHYYSKEMWGLENGYGTEDFYIRITPEGLAALLGVKAEADYENGVLNLVTPEGYDEATKNSIPERDMFFTEGLWGEKGYIPNHTHYIIYNSDGEIMEEITTREDVLADCQMITRSVVMVRTHGILSIDTLTFYDTDSGKIYGPYNFGRLISYPHVLYAPEFSGKVVIANIETGKEYVITDKASKELKENYRSFELSPDGTQITLKYTIYQNGEHKEVTETLPVVLP